MGPIEREDQGVTITSKDMYLQLVQLTVEFRSMAEGWRERALQLTDHESRIRSLERWRYALPTSIGAALLALASLAIQAIGGHT